MESKHLIPIASIIRHLKNYESKTLKSKTCKNKTKKWKRKVSINKTSMRQSGVIGTFIPKISLNLRRKSTS